MSLKVTTLKSAKIAALNDALRTTLMGGKIMMTAGINSLPDRTKANVLTAVRTFNDFNNNNDPHGEPLQVLTAHESGIENVVSFLTDAISAQQLEMLASLLDEFKCESVVLF